jgi:hypothetical protein
MNYSNPQFVAAVKKILRTLAGETDEDKAAVQKDTRAPIHEELSAPIVHELHVPDATIDRIKGQSAREQRHERFKDWVETATIGVVLLYTVFAGFQWYELNTQNINQSAATLGASANADRTFRQGKQALETQQRAWVGAWAEIRRTHSAALDVIDFRVVLKNTGPTPALNVKVDPGWLFKDRNYLIDSDFSKGNTLFLNPEMIGKTSRYVVLPNDTSYGPWRGFNVHHPPSSNPPARWLFITGEVTYDDILAFITQPTFANEYRVRRLFGQIFRTT